MSKGKLVVDFKLKHKWLIMLISYPLVKMGFNAWIPKFCIKYGKPYFVEDK